MVSRAAVILYSVLRAYRGDHELYREENLDYEFNIYNILYTDILCMRALSYRVIMLA